MCKSVIFILVILSIITPVLACTSNNEFTTANITICTGSCIYRNESNLSQWIDCDNTVSCKITAFYPNGTLLVAYDDMIRDGNKFNYSINNTISGDYRGKFNCYRSKGWFEKEFVFKVTISIPSAPSSGDSSGGISPEKTSPELCNVTYDQALNGYYNLIEYKTFSSYTIKLYVYNWQEICSDIMNKTLEPKDMCQKIYFYSLGDNKDITILKNDINSKIRTSDNLINYYINHYNQECYYLGYSDKIARPLSIVAINQTNEIICNQQSGLYIPFFHISFGKVDCQKANDWIWLFKFDVSDNLEIIGINLWIVLLLMFLLIVTIIIIVYRRNGKS